LKQVDKRDLAAGAALIGVGLVFAVGALQLRIGTARSMGAGFFPLIFSIAAIVLGVLVVIPALSRAGDLVVPPWRPFLAISASLLVFTVVMAQFGMLPAVAATVCVAALADRRSSPVGTLVLAAALAAGCWAIFVLGLGLAIPVFRFPF